ncbi:hypothetical protein FOZ63_000157 [Perkinsus olseni]|uniref:Pseudouridine synthase RsuA/RluA-like domain-containing protein n=1 Tax=Perkinsus olseni TaxID=32597 RepID=A0A7J6TLI3_PEROL|nr:hypothetical protein FOZ63_000157 [Perkinsus olseni]
MVIHYIEGLYQGMSVKADEIKERLATNCSFCRGDVLSFLRPSSSSSSEPSSGISSKVQGWYKDTAGGMRHSPVTFTKEEAAAVNDNGGDCYTCRMVGFATFTAASAYCLAEAKRSAVAGRRVFRGLSGLFAALALVRGFTPARPIDVSTLNVVDKAVPTPVVSPLAGGGRMIGKCNRDLSTTLMRLLHTTAGRVGSRSLLLEIGGCRDPETLGNVIHRKCADFEHVHWITALRRFAQLNPDHLSSDTRLTLKVCLSLPVRNLDFRAVSDLVWALGTLGSSRAAAQPFVDHSVRLVRLSPASPDLQRVAALLVGIARGKFERGCLMLALEDRLCCDGSWKGRDVSLCLWALGRFSYEGKLVDVLADWVMQAGPSGMSEQDWSVALFNLGRLGRFDLALVPRASGLMNDSRNIATLLWSAGQAEGGARILWRAVKDHYDVLSDRLLPADIPQVMWALTRIDNSKALGTLALRLAEKLKNSNWVPMNRLEINNVAYGLHWTGVMDLPLYQWLHALMSAHLVKLPTRKASSGVMRKIPEEVVDGTTEPLVVYSGLGGVSIVYKPNAWTTEMTQSFLGESLVLAHRIDFGTSGPLMGTTSGAEEAVLALQQQAGLVVKKYWCLVEGILMEKEGKIEARIENLETWCVVSEDGKPAVTKYTVRREFKSVGVSLVECRLLSGRKHQIRVHMASLGHPLVGDPWYNSETKLDLSAGRIFLHCHKLEWFDLYLAEERYGVEVPLPRDLRDVMSRVERLENSVG